MRFTAQRAKNGLSPAVSHLAKDLAAILAGGVVDDPTPFSRR